MLRFWKFWLFLNYPEKPIYPPTYPPKNPRVGRYFKKPGFFPNPGLSNQLHLRPTLQILLSTEWIFCQKLWLHLQTTTHSKSSQPSMWMSVEWSFRECRPPLVRDLASGFCCGKNQYYNKECKQCLCKPGFVWYDPSRACLCPFNEFQVNDACQCVTGTVRNPLTGKCCPPNETWVNGKCVCKPGYVRIPPNKQCVPGKCPVKTVCE